MNLIPDNTAVVTPILNELKANFSSGITRSLEFRQKQLENLIRGMKELKNDWNEALGKDLGCSEQQCELSTNHVNIKAVTHVLDGFKEWAKCQPIDTPLLVAPSESHLYPEPLGVALVLSSWNYPQYTALSPLATAISAGNCVVLKPSELAPYTSKVFQKLFDNYLDKRCFRCIQGQVQVAIYICKQPWDLIIYTGSTEKGRMVAQSAAANLTPCILELGGKSPVFVDESANIENAAYKIAYGRFLNCGQTCIAADYVLCHKNVKSKFTEMIVQKVKEFYGEDPSKSLDYNRIVTDFHTERLSKLVTENHGGKVLIGGDFDIKNKYFAPTVVDSPRVDSLMMKDEIFGPILPIVSVDDIDAAIKFINSRPKALVAHYYGDTQQNIQKIKEQTSSGTLAINECILWVANSNLPFGGVGNSGIGKCHGQVGFNHCSHLKSVYHQSQSAFQCAMEYPPLTPAKMKMFMQAITVKMTMNQIKKYSLYGGSILIVILAAVLLSYLK